MALRGHSTIQGATDVWERFPSLPEQANIALRHFCKEGDRKWISLLLWLGADPFKPGSEQYDDRRRHPGEGISAIAFAALYEHFDVFELKQLKINVCHPSIRQIIHYLNEGGEAFELLKRWLEQGLPPNDQANGGSSVLQSWLRAMSWALATQARHRTVDRLDTERARATIKSIHLLTRHGARWAPLDKDEIADARRSLSKLIPDYTVELIWIFSKYNACSRDSAQSLVNTPSMKAHLRQHTQRIRDLIASLDE